MADHQVKSNGIGLDALTEKIYREGMEKGSRKAQELIQEAEQKGREIVEKAQQEADALSAESQRELALQKRNTEAELKLKGKQIISSLKRKIRRAIALKVLEEPIGQSFSDAKFIKTLILEIIKTWDPKQSVELQLPNKLRDKMDQALEASIRREIKDLTISFDSDLEAGFRIGRIDDTYQITFSDKDFTEFFRPYFNEKANSMLFGD